MWFGSGAAREVRVMGRPIQKEGGWGGDKHVQVHLLLWFRGRATREAKVIGPPIFLKGGGGRAR